MRKTRSDAVLLNLPEEQQAKLAEWMLGGTPYHECKVLVEKEFGIKVGSLARFAEFWQAVCQPALLARRQRAAGTAAAVSNDAQAKPAAFGAATLELLDQKAFELLTAPNPKVSDLKAVLGLFVKVRDQDIERERLQMLKKKAAQADEAKNVLEKKELSEAERVSRMRAVFGMS